jgi:hypothetical protein
MAVNGTTFDRQTGTVQTIDVTSTPIIDYALPDDCGAIITVRIIGRREATGAVNVYQYMQGYERDSGGSAAAVGGTTAIHVQEQDASWGPNLTVSGNNARINVVGANSQTIEWVCFLEAVILEAN